MTIDTSAFETVVSGNGSATVFSFSPVVLYADGQLTVFMLDNLGNQTQLVEGTATGNFGVTVNGGYPGTGSITYPNDGVSPPLPTGWKLYILPNFPVVQTLALDNQGGYLPENQEQAFDYLTMLILQLQAEIDQCLQVPVTTTVAASTLVGDIATLGAVSTAVSELAAIQANITTAAAAAAAITTVAGIAPAVTTVAGFSANIASMANSQFRYVLGASQSMTVDPGIGVVNANNATFNSVTEFLVNNFPSNGGTLGSSLSAFLATVGGSSSAIKGYVTIFDLNQPGYFAVFQITGASALVAGQVSYTVPVSYVAGSLGTVIQPGDTLTVAFYRTGDAGNGNGTVTSVGLAVPAALLTQSGGPVTTTGTVTVALAAQNKALVFASNATTDAQTPTFRALVASDLPAVNSVNSAPSYFAAQSGVG